MSVFTEKELEYMATQRLGRLATLTKDGAPHLSAVGFRYNPELDTIDIGGRDLPGTAKWREVKRDGRVSFLIDDVQPPWTPRSMEIRGHAETIEADGTAMNSNFGPGLIRIKPTRVVALGIDTAAYSAPNSRNVGQAAQVAAEGL